MNGKAFLDSNIFIYGYDDRDPRKQRISLDLIRGTTLDGTAVISYQVVHEFLNFALVKAASKMRPDDAQQFIATVFRPLLTIPPTFALISEVIRIQERYRMSWYDSLIVSAAQQAGCDVLYSEDFQDGQHFGSLTIQNPFR